MNPILKNILAVITGILVGGALNMGIIMISSSIIPPPPGANLTTTEGLQASMHLMQPKHFLFPFLAHALGTLAGALLAALIAADHRIRYALIVGAWFLLGGIIMVLTVPSPLWFTVLDLGFAYLPIAYLAGRLVNKKNPS